MKNKSFQFRRPHSPHFYLPRKIGKCMFSAPFSFTTRKKHTRKNCHPLRLLKCFPHRQRRMCVFSLVHGRELSLSSTAVLPEGQTEQIKFRALASDKMRTNIRMWMRERERATWLSRRSLSAKFILLLVFDADVPSLIPLSCGGEDCGPCASASTINDILRLQIQK